MFREHTIFWWIGRLLLVIIGCILLAVVLFWGYNWLHIADRASAEKPAYVAPTTKAPVVQAPVAVEEQVSAPPQPAVVARVINPADFDAAVFIKGALPMYQDLRTHVRVPGDTSSFLINFTVDFPRLTLLRLVGDDVITSATYFASPTAAGVDLLPLLQMGPVNADEPADANMRKYMEARGVNLSGEQLAQNYQPVFLGEVKAGAYITVYFKDDPSLQVNSGGLISFSGDTDVYTVDLSGNVVENPSFVLEAATP